jgi:hypothetical protein
MKVITAYLKRKYSDLPIDWQVYSIWKLEGEGEDIAEIKGAIARRLKSGKNKGQLTWDSGGERKFLMLMSEYNLAHEENK